MTREPPEIPPGHAIVEHIGWDDDGRFTATLVFPNGPPDLPLIVVWGAQPVMIVATPSQEPPDAG